MKPHTKRHLPSLEQLELMDGIELRAAFTDSNIGHIPKNASAQFLRGQLAWSIQAIRFGYDPVALRRSLIGKLQNSTRLKAPLYKPGTRLLREWQGVTHEVTIEEEGFTWDSKRYGSLSEIARAITGTRWSGPRFFGLEEKQRG